MDMITQSNIGTISAALGESSASYVCSIMSFPELTFDPVYVTAVHNAWDLAKRLDSWVPYLETTGEAAKTALKCCLYPCYPAPPMIMLTRVLDYTGKGMSTRPSSG